jgi:hypothetical protein
VDLATFKSITSVEISPTLTYKVDYENKCISGKVDDVDAVIQMIDKVLRTDKYSKEIYNWYFGNELFRLMGQPYEYVVAELPRIVSEALLTDDRILDVTDFQFEKSSVDSVAVTFAVKHIYGVTPYSMEVAV